MKKLFILSGIVLLTVSFYHCKKENELFTSKTIDSLFYTTNEKNIIFNGDTVTPFSTLVASNSQDSIILHKVSRNVKVPNDTTTYLAKRMLFTLKQFSSYTSISAPEIGINRNIIVVMRTDKDSSYQIMINPKITQHSTSTNIYNETCITRPGSYPAQIERYNFIIIEYYDLQGIKHSEMVEYSAAAIIQHAISHLGGGVLPIATDPLAFTPSEVDTIMALPDTTPMRILLITNYQDSLILRKQSIDVRPDSNDIVLMTLIRRMKKALDQTTGVGIAAPQVGINRNIIWVKRLDKPGKPFEVYLNPKIVMTSQATVQFNGDGCLSVPGITGKTLRWAAIGIEYDLLDGSHHTEVVQGTSIQNFTAVIFQHEIDHLNGILFIDRIVQK